MEEDEPPDLEFRVLDTTTQAAVCEETRQIARLKPAVANCPNITNWTRRNLLARGTPYLDTLPAPANASQLSRFCAYDYAGPGPLVVADVADHVAFVEVGEDCNSVLPADSLVDALTPPLRDLVRNRLGYATDTDLKLTITEPLRSAVDVTVIDTTATVVTVPPNDDHGIVVADLIRDVACPGPSPTCAVNVQNVLGLTLTKDETGIHNDWEAGGYFGRQSIFAAAIVEAVRRWENDPTPGKLVLNMSVGWAPVWFGGDTPQAPPGVDAVETALRYARCRGALPIVAAGNEEAECEDGPTAPALWETRPAPTAAQCWSEFQITNAPVPASPAPLVFAVGGLDFTNQELPVSRPGGRSRLAAIGARVPGLEHDHLPRSGTSMSNAIVAGTAAMLWSYQPALSADEVIDRLYDSGITLPNQLADFGFPNESLQIKRVSLCKALSEACTASGTCPAALNSLPCLQNPLLTRHALFEAAQGVVADLLPPMQFEPIGVCESYCAEESSTQRNTDPLAGAPTSCETPEYPHRTAHLLAPQPATPPCPTCTISTSQDEADVQTNPDNDVYDLEYVRIVVDAPSLTVRLQNLYGDVDELNSIRATGLPFPGVPSDADRAWIYFKYRGYAEIKDTLEIIP